MRSNASRELLLTHPQVPYGPNYKSKNEDNEKKRSWGALPDS
jgi:hypothetical protein